MGGYLMSNMTKEGIIYARVSSHKQLTDGNGLSSQISACRAFAKKKNIEVIKVIEDPAQSGGSIYRPGIMDLVACLVERKKLTYIIFDELSRLSRNTEEYYDLKRQISKLKGVLLSADGSTIDEDPESRVREGMRVVFADYERANNRRRVMRRQRERLRAGYWVFRAPIGYHHENKVMKIDEDRAKYIRKIFHDFSQGKYTTYQAIKDSDEAKLLINPKSNTSYVLKVCDIKKMLKNKIYIGKIELKKWGVEETDGVHEAIIDERTFYKVQDQLNQKGVKKHNKIRSEEFPLKGDLICGNCKTTLVYNKTKGRNKKYPYYRCNGTRDICDTSPKSIQTDKVHDDFLNLLSGASIHPKVLKLADRVIEDIYKDKSDHLKGIRQTKRARINELVKARDRHIKTLINSENEHVKKALEDEINKIDKEISALESQKENTEHLESFKLEGIKLLENPKECWLEANYQERKLIFDFVFDQPLEITKGKIGTAPYALPYSLLASKEIQKEGMVELSGLEPLTSTLPV